MVVYVSGLMCGDVYTQNRLYSTVLQEQGVERLSPFLGVMVILGVKLTRDGVIAVARIASAAKAVVGC